MLPPGTFLGRSRIVRAASTTTMRLRDRTAHEVGACRPSSGLSFETVEVIVRFRDRLIRFGEDRCAIGVELVGLRFERGSCRRIEVTAKEGDLIRELLSERLERIARL